MTGTGHGTLIDPVEAGPRGRYELLTSLVVPRPIGWISTWAADGIANLAPFSYFGAISATPMLVSVSIGRRRVGDKDTARNILDRGAFCANVVTTPWVRAMVASSAEVAPEVDEFDLVSLEASRAERVDAPYVRGCPAVLECRLYREIALEEVPTTLVLGEVVAIRIADELPFEPGSRRVDPKALGAVGRLGGDAYALPGGLLRIPRPR